MESTGGKNKIGVRKFLALKDQVISAVNAAKWLSPRTGVILLVIIAAGIAGVVWRDTISGWFGQNSDITRSEAEELIAKVSKLIVLPEGELPTIATVSDPEKVKSQPFFARAKKGDKVLIFANARRAILYDPVADKIVEVAPINLGSPIPAPSATP